MNGKEKNDQGDLFPEELSKEQAKHNECLAEKILREKRVFPARINSYWGRFYQENLKNWHFDDSLVQDLWFDYEFLHDSHLKLLFYHPTAIDLKLSSSDYELFAKKLKNMLTPDLNQSTSKWALSSFLNWTIANYEILEFPRNKHKRMRELMIDSGIGIDNVDVINVLETNVWTIKRDHSNSRPVIQLQAELNTLTKVFIIDHFDEDAEEDILFNIDSIKYWSRPDGEGFENAYNELQSRVEQEISDSTKTGFIAKFKNWFG